MTFCRVSELFHRLCLPVLYRVVVLGDYERAKTFLELIAAHPGRAEAIRSFTVTERARVFDGTEHNRQVFRLNSRPAFTHNQQG